MKKLVDGTFKKVIITIFHVLKKEYSMSMLKETWMIFKKTQIELVEIISTMSEGQN